MTPRGGPTGYGKDGGTRRELFELRPLNPRPAVFRHDGASAALFRGLRGLRARLLVVGEAGALEGGDCFAEMTRLEPSGEVGVLGILVPTRVPIPQAPGLASRLFRPLTRTEEAHL